MPRPKDPKKINEIVGMDDFYHRANTVGKDSYRSLASGICPLLVSFVQLTDRDGHRTLLNGMECH